MNFKKTFQKQPISGGSLEHTPERGSKNVAVLVAVAVAVAVENRKQQNRDREKHRA